MDNIVILSCLTIILIMSLFCIKEEFITCHNTEYGFEHNHKKYHDKCLNKSLNVKKCRFDKKRINDMLLGDSYDSEYNPDYLKFNNNQSRYDNGNKLNKSYKNFTQTHRIPFLISVNNNRPYVYDTSIYSNKNITPILKPKTLKQINKINKKYLPFLT